MGGVRGGRWGKRSGTKSREVVGMSRVGERRQLLAS